MAPSSVECLACGERRSLDADAHTNLATGECPRCRFRGWDYSDELDGFTQRMVFNGAFNGPVVERRSAPRDTRRAA